MTQNIFIKAFKAWVLDLLAEILYFPVWWYAQGLKSIILHVKQSIYNTNRNLALGLMFRNLFKPMFGQYDRQGRIISFFMRLILTLGRLVAFIVLSILYLLLIVFWVILPPIVVLGIISNFSSLWN